MTDTRKEHVAEIRQGQPVTDTKKDTSQKRNKDSSCQTQEKNMMPKSDKDSLSLTQKIIHRRNATRTAHDRHTKEHVAEIR